MLSTIEILQQCNQIFRDILENDDIVLRMDTTADEIEEWDSLTHIQLIVAVERHYKIKFSSAEINSFKNVGDLCDTVEKKLELKTA